MPPHPHRGRDRGRTVSATLMAAALTAACAAGTGDGAVRGAPDTQIRQPAVAGGFYPRDPAKLRAAVDGFLRRALPSDLPDVRVLVVPHAGYVYSGQIAADAFQAAAGQAVDTVVLLGANHTTAGFPRASVYDGAAWHTPLGAVSVDRDLAQALVAATGDAVFDRRLHEKEHSIEVQVPFVQALWPAARILPIVVGSADPAMCTRLGRALAATVAGRRVLIVAASDLSHYPGEAAARRVDAATLTAIATGDGLARLAGDEVEPRTTEGLGGIPGLETRACGLGAVMVATEAARQLGAGRAAVLSYANSADSPVGDPARVVGYGAVAFAEGPPGADVQVLSPPRADAASALDLEDRRQLIALARQAIDDKLRRDVVPLPRGGSPRLLRERGVFVTLKRNGELRGCVGRVVGEGQGPLRRLVSLVALEAAFADPRFPPVTPGEWPHLDVEVSVLTPPTAVSAAGEITPGRDGVVLVLGKRSAVFLPQIATEQGWNREQLLDNLALKAGLGPADWRERDARLYTFQALVFDDAAVR